MKRPRRKPYWSRKRVDEGLVRAARDIWNNDEKRLPTSTQAYTAIVSEHEPIKPGGMRKLYPSAKRILDFYTSLNHAWFANGFLSETVIHKKSSQVITPEVDAKLREIYSYGRKGGRMPPGVPTVKAYARTLGVGAHLLSQRAAKLGLVTPKEKPWSKPELKLLEKLGHLSPAVIWRKFREKGFNRTELAIGLMRKRRQAHKGSPYYSIHALSVLLGFDAHKFDRDWLQRFPKELPFEMKGTARDRRTKQNGDTRLIHVNTIREFIFNHPEEIDLHKVDKMWFLWLITKGRVKMVESKRIGKRVEGFQPQLVREHRGARTLKRIADKAGTKKRARTAETRRAA